LSAGSASITGALNARNATITETLTANRIRVNDLLCANEVKVSRTPCWPDFVFGSEYKLPSLNEVEEFITENKHLPNIPSAAEVETSGINLGEMNAQLLQKIEELTLYLLQQEKKIADLQSQMEQLKKQ
jgi:hypothetical protein